MARERRCDRLTIRRGRLVRLEVARVVDEPRGAAVHAEVDPADEAIAGEYR